MFTLRKLMLLVLFIVPFIGPSVALSDRAQPWQLRPTQRAFSTDSLDKMYHDVWKVVAEKYHDPSRLALWYEWEHKYEGKLNTIKDLEDAIQEMLGSLNDKWTLYISIEELKIRQRRAIEGICDLGIKLRQKADGAFAVDNMHYRSSSYESELRWGDIIKSIGAEDLRGKTSQEVNDLMWGKIGTCVDIVYSRNGRDKEITLTFRQTPKAVVEYRLLPDNIGYIYLPGFDEQVCRDFNNGLVALHLQADGNLKGLVLDLRGNPGGSVNHASLLVSSFLRDGTILRTTMREGLIVIERELNMIHPQRHDYSSGSKQMITGTDDLHEIPMAVLVDGSTASSAEIVTSALQDNGRATIIGTTTYGKAVAYERDQIPPGGILMVTSMDYLTGGGFDISGRGITPDVVVERIPGASDDAPLLKAIEIIGGPSKGSEQVAVSSVKKGNTWFHVRLIVCILIVGKYLVWVRVYRG
ncbi:MAG: hypothetical protein K8F91_20270 [Candidatus Obscuribacterales bacterium]|nr:hypothetical protein [Candidatus Obscuribacterales bacterium]